MRNCNNLLAALAISLAFSAPASAGALNDLVAVSSDISYAKTAPRPDKLIRAPRRGIPITDYDRLAGQPGYSDIDSRKDLTSAERAAFNTYKSSAFYDCIQRFLFTSGADTSFCSLMRGNVKDNIDRIKMDMDAVFRRSKLLPGGLYLFRGQNDLTENIGAIIERKGFTSTSLAPEEARKFYRGTMLVIGIPTGGHPGVLVSRWEKEVLLPANSRFIILDKQQVNGETRILLEACRTSCSPGPVPANWEQF